MYLLDTNICIYFMKNMYPGLTQKLLSLDPSSLMISSVTVLKLQYGAAKSNWGAKNRQKLALFLAPFNILPFTADDAIYASIIRAELEKKGTKIGPYDVQLTGQALSRNLIFVTHNTEKFARVQNLQLEDWVS